MITTLPYASEPEIIASLVDGAERSRDQLHGRRTGPDNIHSGLVGQFVTEQLALTNIALRRRRSEKLLIRHMRRFDDDLHDLREDLPIAERKKIIERRKAEYLATVDAICESERIGKYEPEKENNYDYLRDYDSPLQKLEGLVDTLAQDLPNFLSDVVRAHPHFRKRDPLPGYVRRAIDASGIEEGPNAVSVQADSQKAIVTYLTRIRTTIQDGGQAEWARKHYRPRTIAEIARQQGL